MDDAQHRADAQATSLDGGDVRLGTRGDHLPAGLLPLDGVVLPQVLRDGAGLPQEGTGGLLPDLQDDAGPRAGHRRGARLRALRHAGHQEGPGAVVLPHHRLRRGTAGLFAARLAGEDHHRAAELDRAQRGRGGRLQGRAGGPAGGRERRSHRLHHPSRHALGRDLYGACAGASAGREDHQAAVPRGGGSLPLPGGAAVGDRSAEHGQGEDRRLHRRLRHQPRQRRAHPHLDCRLRDDDLRHRRDHGRPGAR